MAGLVGHDGRFEGLRCGVRTVRVDQGLNYSTFVLRISHYNIRRMRGDVDTKLQLVVG